MALHLPVVIGLLVAALLLAIGAKRAHLPYNVALVIGGMLITLSHALPETPQLAPEVVFLLCLPALLFEGGFTAHLGSIRANLVPISLLATVGLLMAIGATGAFLHLGLRLPWGPALLLGSILSVTDTVSILFAFRRAPVPNRLASIVLGESLFNDGTALVAYAAIAGIVAGAPLEIPVLGARVVIATAGGLAVGLALGLVGSWILRRAEDPLAEIMATTAIAFAAFVGAEELHVSGAIAAVAAGLTVGATVRKTLSPTSQVTLDSFWEYVAFGVNTFLFLSVAPAVAGGAVAVAARLRGGQHQGRPVDRTRAGAPQGHPVPDAAGGRRLRCDLHLARGAGVVARAGARLARVDQTRPPGLRGRRAAGEAGVRPCRARRA